MEQKQTMADIKAHIKKLLHGEGKMKLIVLLGVCGIALILVSEFLPKQAKTKEGARQPETAATSEAYAAQLEDKIHALVTSIEGVGKANVLVTLENGVEYVYASAEKKNTDVTQDYSDSEVKKLHEKDNSENSYILVDNGNGKEALLKTRIEPKVKGIVVVCEGAEDIVVEERVIDAVKTALGLSSTQVCVTKMAPQTKTR